MLEVGILSGLLTNIADDWVMPDHVIMHLEFSSGNTI